MKHTYKTILSMAIIAGFFGCSDPEIPEANLTNTTTPFVANFTFANASPDAPKLSFFVNNTKIGSEVGSDAGYTQSAYTPVAITSSGLAGTATANTNIRAKGASAAIGGLLGSNDLIYRSANNSSNNFVAIAGNSYTVFVVDSINRPAPLRTLNSGNFGDITYYNPLNGKQLSVVERATLSDAEKNNLVTIGTVPLGSSDPGGIRFYLVQDVFPTIATPTTQAGVRIVNAAPNANGTPGGPALFVRFRAATSSISFTTATTHVMNSASLNPSVGSRTVTTTPPAAPVANFSLLSIAVAGVPINYTLEVSTVSTYTSIAYSAPISFVPGKNYTIFLRGLVGKSGSKGLSHGIITHN